MNEAIKQAVSRCIKQGIPLSIAIENGELNLLGSNNGKLREISLCFQDMSNNDINNYLMKCLIYGKESGALKFPRDNRIETLSNYVLGFPFRTELYHHSFKMPQVCLNIFNAWIKNNTWEALYERRELVIENCGYEDIPLLDKTKKLIEHCKKESIGLGDIYSDYGIKKKQQQYYFLNNSILPLKSDEYWIEYIKNVVHMRAEQGQEFHHNQTIVGEIFGGDIFEVYQRMNKTAEARFHNIIELAGKAILKEFIFLPESLKIKGDLCIANRKSLAQVYEKACEISYFEIIGYMDKQMISRVGEIEFYNYLVDMIKEELQKEEADILTVSKNILGVATHSFNQSHRGSYTCLEKLFYRAWIESVPEHYSDDEFTNRIFTKVGYTEKQKLAWRSKRYEYKCNLDEMTLDEVMIRCRKIVNEFVQSGRILNRYYFYAELLDAPREIFQNTKFSQIKYQKEIDEYLAPEIRNYEAKLKKNNIKILKNQQLKKRLYYKMRESYWSYGIDFSVVKSKVFRQEILVYLTDCYDENNDLEIQALCRDAVRVLEMFRIAEENFGVVSIKQITTKMVGIVLHRLEYDEENSPLTVKNKFTSLKKLCFYHFEKGTINANPCLNIKFHNAHEHVKHTDYIPDEVLEQLDMHIKELPEKYQLLYRLFSETGARFKEIADIKVQDILERTDDGGYILIYPSKVARARYNRGYEDKILKFISAGTYDDLVEYVKNKEKERKEADIDYVFFEKTRGRYSSMAAKSYNDFFTDLIKKHDIRSENGELWHFHSKQTRKTAAVIMINSGAELEDVQHFMGHVSSQTTASYYAQVKYLTVQKLNTEFFRKKFGVIVGDTMLAKFNEEERKELYVDFLLKQRELPLGKCIRHPSEGKCNNMANMVACATCPRLCTGKKYVAKWKKLLDDSQARVKEMVQIYENKGIEESQYIFFAEYARELKIQNAYECVLDNIREGEAI